MRNYKLAMFSCIWGVFLLWFLQVLSVVQSEICWARQGWDLGPSELSSVFFFFLGQISTGSGNAATQWADPFDGIVNTWSKTRRRQGGSSSSQLCVSWVNLLRQHFGFETKITHRRINILLEMLLAAAGLPEKPQPVFEITPWTPRSSWKTSACVWDHTMNSQIFVWDHTMDSQTWVSLAPFHVECEPWEVFQAAW